MDSIKEYELAKSSNFISQIFSEQTSPQHQELIQNYINSINEFMNGAEKRDIRRQLREELKKSLSPENQKKYDHRIFENEGMMYCLEFYLALYKAIIDAPSKQEKARIVF